MIVYGHENWASVLHEGMDKQNSFILYIEGHNIDLNRVFQVNGIKKMYIVRHLWVIVILEMEHYDEIQKLFEMGFKIGLIRKSKSSKIEGKGFYRIAEI
jgi:hypothetical protein